MQCPHGPKCVMSWMWAQIGAFVTLTQPLSPPKKVLDATLNVDKNRNLSIFSNHVFDKVLKLTPKPRPESFQDAAPRPSHDPLTCYLWTGLSVEWSKQAFFGLLQFFLATGFQLVWNLFKIYREGRCLQKSIKQTLTLSSLTQHLLFVISVYFLFIVCTLLPQTSN